MMFVPHSKHGPPRSVKKMALLFLSMMCVPQACESPCPVTGIGFRSGVMFGPSDGPQLKLLSQPSMMNECGTFIS
jgi:hypothetical protein